MANATARRPRKRTTTRPTHERTLSQAFNHVYTFSVLAAISILSVAFVNHLSVMQSETQTQTQLLRQIAAQQASTN